MKRVKDSDADPGDLLITGLLSAVSLGILYWLYLIVSEYLMDIVMAFLLAVVGFSVLISLGWLVVLILINVEEWIESSDDKNGQDDDLKIDWKQ